MTASLETVEAAAMQLSAEERGELIERLIDTVRARSARLHRASIRLPRGAQRATPTGESPVPVGVGAPGSSPVGWRGNSNNGAQRSDHAKRARDDMELPLEFTDVHSNLPSSNLPS